MSYLLFFLCNFATDNQPIVTLMITTDLFGGVLNLRDDERTITEAEEPALWAYCHLIGKQLDRDPHAIVFYDLEFAREWMSKTYPGQEIRESVQETTVRIVKGIFEDLAAIRMYILSVPGDSFSAYVVDYTIRMD